MSQVTTVPGKRCGGMLRLHPQPRPLRPFNLLVPILISSRPYRSYKVFTLSYSMCIGKRSEKWWERKIFQCCDDQSKVTFLWSLVDSSVPKRAPTSLPNKMTYWDVVSSHTCVSQKGADNGFVTIKLQWPSLHFLHFLRREEFAIISLHGWSTWL